LRDRQLIGCLLNAYIVEPDNALVAIRELRPIVAVKNLGLIVVGFEVSMDNGLGMMLIRLVDMFWRDRRRQHEQRRESERDGRAPQRLHDGVIMGHVAAVGQTPPSRSFRAVLQADTQQPSRVADQGDRTKTQWPPAARSSG
jgi:hypothetical protein